jgi:hypothetical protein
LLAQRQTELEAEPSVDANGADRWEDALNNGTFAASYTYMKAAIIARFRMGRAFGVKPKGVGGAITLRRMLPEFCLFMGSLTAVIGGLAHMVLNGPTVPYVFNTVWAAYHAATVSVLFVYLNRPVTIAEREPLLRLPLSRRRLR